MILFAIACVTAQQLADAQCQVACQYRGYDGGKSDKAVCYCFNALPKKELFKKRLVIPEVKRMNFQEQPEVVVPEPSPW